MQRVPPVDPEQASAQVTALWEGVEKLLGRVPNSWRVLAHTPDVATWLLSFSATLHRDGAGSVLSARIKNLVAVQTSLTNQCAYCTAHNASFGRSLGLTSEQMGVLEAGEYLTSPLFDEREKAAIDWAREVTMNTAKFNKECFATLQEHYNDPEIVEMTLMAGLFALWNRFNDSLFIDIEPQDNVDQIRRTAHLPRHVVHDFARSAAVEATTSDPSV